jgi:hypothetical protein
VQQYTFELIICGPHKELPEELQDKSNVQHIQDFGCPTRAQQISTIPASGRYMAWAADDGWFYPNKLAECINILDRMHENKRALVTQYIEGGRDGLGNYTMNYHEPIRSPYYPNNFLIFNSVIVVLDHFRELGGFDCRFEACPMAFADLGARMQKDGCAVKLLPTIFECTHMMGDTGDHAPIHYGQIEHDQPLYRQIWRDPACVDRLKIDFDNWKEAPEVWERRFNKDDLNYE